MNCDNCEALTINGLFCHETGCPNARKTWDADREDDCRYNTNRYRDDELDALFGEEGQGWVPVDLEEQMELESAE